MELKQLQSFAAVVKHESFTRAAQALYLSQPTVSTHVRQLEAELGVTLVTRTTKAVDVTEKGRELYEYAEKILQLRNRMIDLCGETRRILHLGASTIPAAYLLPELLPAFGALHPEVYFVLHQSDSRGVLDGLRDRTFDLGLVGMTEADDRLEFTPVCRDRMVLITPVTEEFLALHGRASLPLEELLRGPVILREQGSGSRKSAERFLAGAGISEDALHVTARINDQEAIKNLVAGGVGVSIVSERAARDLIRARRVLAFPLPDPDGGRELCLAARRGEDPKPWARDFARFAARYYKDRD